MPDKAPCPGTVLDVLPVVEQRQGTEEQRDSVNDWQHRQAPATREAAPVEVRVSDGEVALQGHREEHEHRGKTEESHCEGEIGAHTALGSQGHQCLVPRIGSQDHRTDETGPQQVGEHQLCHQHVEQGDRGPAAGTTPCVPAPTACQQRQRNKVPQNPGREHHRTDGWAILRVEPLSTLAELYPPGVFRDITHGGGLGGEILSPPGWYLTARGSEGPGAPRHRREKGRDRNPELPSGPQLAPRAASPGSPACAPSGHFPEASSGRPRGSRDSSALAAGGACGVALSRRLGAGPVVAARLATSIVCELLLGVVVREQGETH